MYFVSLSAVVHIIVKSVEEGWREMKMELGFSPLELEVEVEVEGLKSLRWVEASRMKVH